MIQARIAERLGCLAARGVRDDPAHGARRPGRRSTGTIRLTAEGAQLAEQVVRRHRLAERFLTDILGLSWAEAHHEAGKWEHVISEPVEAAMVRVLGDPTTCPHGNPIPGSDYDAPDAVALTDARLSAPASRSAASPRSSSSRPGLLDFLEESRDPARACRHDHRGVARWHDHGRDRRPPRRRRLVRQRPHPRHCLNLRRRRPLRFRRLRSLRSTIGASRTGGAVRRRSSSYSASTSGNGSACTIIKRLVARVSAT